MTETPSWGTPEPSGPSAPEGTPDDGTPLWGTPQRGTAEAVTDESRPRPSSRELPRRRVVLERSSRRAVARRRGWRRIGEIAGLCAFLALPVGGYVLQSRDVATPGAGSVERLGVAPGPAEPVRESIFGLTLGLCFDGTAAGDVERVTCDEPHHAQYVGSTTFDRGPYPGDAAVAGALDGRCAALFRDFTGIEYDRQSDLVLERSVIGQVLWDSGFREVRCAVHRADGGVLTDTTHP